MASQELWADFLTIAEKTGALLSREFIEMEYLSGSFYAFFQKYLVCRICLDFNQHYPVCYCNSSDIHVWSSLSIPVYKYSICNWISNFQQMVVSLEVHTLCLV